MTDAVVSLFTTATAAADKHLTRSCFQDLAGSSRFFFPTCHGEHALHYLTKSAIISSWRLLGLLMNLSITTNFGSSARTLMPGWLERLPDLLWVNDTSCVKHHCRSGERL